MMIKRYVKYLLLIIYTVSLAFCDTQDPMPPTITHTTYEIYSVNLDGSNLKKITTGNDYSQLPDGKLIYLDNNKIYKCNPDGTDKVLISPSNMSIGFYKYYRGGSKITFPEYTKQGFIPYLINLDGNEVTQLGPYIKSSNIPVISPNGNKVAFTDNSGLYIRNSDGSNQIQIKDTTDGAICEQVDFTPDGNNVIYIYRNNSKFYRDLRLYNTIDSKDMSLYSRAKYGVTDYCTSKWSTLLFFDSAGINLENLLSFTHRFLHSGEEPHFTYDSTKITFIHAVSQTVYIMDISADTTKAINFNMPNKGILHPELSIDKRRVYLQINTSVEETL